MNDRDESNGGDRRRTLIAGGGVAAAEAALALDDLAGDRVAISLIAPNEHFVYRPLAVREPFGYRPAARFPLAELAAAAHARLVPATLAGVDPQRGVAYTGDGAQLPYDDLLIAVGAAARPRYEHALTIDDRRLDEILHGLIQDVEEGYVKRIAFLAAGQAAWPLPLYELALLTAGRAFDADVKVEFTLVTPEDAPLAIFGSEVSARLGEILDAAGISVITSAWAEVPHQGEIRVSPGGTTLRVDRIVALPELFGPPLAGVPRAEHGFLRTDQHGRLIDNQHLFAAGDVTELPIKHGGLAAQQADAAAEAIAAEAGAPLEPRPFTPLIEAILLTDSAPLFISAHISGGHGFSGRISEQPPVREPMKIAARYLSPYLRQHAADMEERP
ncbi:MAG TPA: FAD-dependent oxidoreductase [Solirubrobacteraceae bacterium]|nr:FAD-dependent oxidoreductase [Solirubrobacteraceae bacterium]